MWSPLSHRTLLDSHDFWQIKQSQSVTSGVWFVSHSSRCEGSISTTLLSFSVLLSYCFSCFLTLSTDCSSLAPCIHMCVSRESLHFLFISLMFMSKFSTRFSILGKSSLQKVSRALPFTRPEEVVWYRLMVYSLGLRPIEMNVSTTFPPLSVFSVNWVLSLYLVFVSHSGRVVFSTSYSPVWQ